MVNKILTFLFLVAVTTNVCFAMEIVGVGSGKCLDVKGGNSANGTQVIIWPCHGRANQLWYPGYDGLIVGLAGKCLDVKGNNRADGTPVILWPCHGRANQLWFPAADGTIVSAASGKCLDVKGGSSGNGTPLIIWRCHGRSNQQWQFQ